MKIRAGFVSNSSSSSFCIFGIEVDEDELISTTRLEYEVGIEDIRGYAVGVYPEYFLTKDNINRPFIDVINELATTINEVYPDKKVTTSDLTFITDGGL